MAAAMLRLSAHVAAKQINDAIAAMNELLELSRDAVHSVLRANPHLPQENAAERRGDPFAPQHAFVRECFGRAARRMLKSGSYGMCEDVNGLSMPQYHARCHREAKTLALPLHDASFQPSHLVDLGCREYTTRPAHNPWAQEAFTASSVRFFELHYPGFDGMRLSVFDVDPQLAGTYAPLKGRSKGLRYYPVAAWVHGHGLTFRESHGMFGEYTEGLRDCVRSDARAVMPDGCFCSPSVDFPAFVRAYPPGTLVVKMDVEGGEWPIVEALVASDGVRRLREVFLECHKSPVALFDDGADGAALGDVSPWLRDVWWRVQDQGHDCLLMHDVLRSHGVVTHFWP